MLAVDIGSQQDLNVGSGERRNPPNNTTDESAYSREDELGEFVAAIVARKIMGFRPDYVPYRHFESFHARVQRFALIHSHRRSGKTLALIEDTVGRAISGPTDGKYAFVAPRTRYAFEDAKACAANADAMIKGNVTQRSISLWNGAEIKFVDSAAVDDIRGLGFDGIVFDEPKNPSEISLFGMPTIADRKGWMSIAMTPPMDGTFSDLILRAMGAPDWYYAFLPIHVTGLIDDATLAEMRAMMGPKAYNAEMQCGVGDI